MASTYPLLSVISLSFCLVAYAEEGDWHEEAKTTRAEAARVAVVQWCDARSGQFLLKYGHPFCITTDPVEGIQTVFIGERRTEVATAPRYWWRIRSTFPEVPASRPGVLWVVSPFTYEHTGTDISEAPPWFAEWFECLMAQKALDNPAHVLVYFIGIALNECEERGFLSQ